MKLTIIPIDNAVYVDGLSYSNMVLSNIPNNIHALQWKNSLGHIEFNDGTPNQDITELPNWANNAYNVWLDADNVAKVKAIEEAAIQAMAEKVVQLPLTDSQKLDIIRIERDKRLLASDWTQLDDTPSNIDKAAWAVYRESLRDLPSLPNLNLDNPVYPIPPM